MQNINIGEFVEAHRMTSGFNTQEDLANASKVPLEAIKVIENTNETPNPEIIKELSTHLKSTSLVELMVIAGYWGEEDLLEPITWE